MTVDPAVFVWFRQHQGEPELITKESKTTTTRCHGRGTGNFLTPGVLPEKSRVGRVRGVAKVRRKWGVELVTVCAS